MTQGAAVPPEVQKITARPILSPNDRDQIVWETPKIPQAPYRTHAEGMQLVTHTQALPLSPSISLRCSINLKHT